MKSDKNKGVRGTRFDADEILPEYDFSRARRNPYASRYRKGSAVVVLDPDVAAIFPSPREVNEALRALAGVIQRHQFAPVHSEKGSSK